MHAGALPSRLRLPAAERRGRARAVRLHQGLPALAARSAGVERAVGRLHGRHQAGRAQRRRRRHRAGRQPAAAAQPGHAGLPYITPAEVSVFLYIHHPT